MSSLHAVPRAGEPALLEFEALVGPHLECMFQTARAVLPSEDLAWDAVQETLLQVWRNDRLSRQPRVALRHIVFRASLQIRRSLERRRRHEAAGAVIRNDAQVCNDRICASERLELQRQLDEAIATLPAACREAFLLRETRGADYVTIAHELDVPVGTVKSRLNRARSLLQRRLAGRRHGFVVSEQQKAG